MQAQGFCDISGHKLAYLRQGSGESVLLVHGITTYSFIWRKLIPLLSQRYDVIAIDLLGCGSSDKPLNEPYSIKHHAELINAFTEKLGINHFHYVGHDIGGGIGQVFAVRYSDRIRDLTLINSVAYDYWPVQPISTMRTPIIRQLMMAALDLGALKQIVLRGIYYNEHVDPELIDLFRMPMRTSEGRKAFLHFAKSLDNQDLMGIEADLRSLDLPVLIVRGDADLYLSEAIAERLHREIPGSQLERIPTAGHFAQEDEPEKLADIIMRFYEKVNYGD